MNESAKLEVLKWALWVDEIGIQCKCKHDSPRCIYWSKAGKILAQAYREAQERVKEIEIRGNAAAKEVGRLTVMSVKLEGELERSQIKLRESEATCAFMLKTVRDLGLCRDITPMDAGKKMLERMDTLERILELVRQYSKAPYQESNTSWQRVENALFDLERKA